MKSGKLQFLNNLLKSRTNISDFDSYSNSEIKNISNIAARNLYGGDNNNGTGNGSIPGSGTNDSCNNPSCCGGANTNCNNNGCSGPMENTNCSNTGCSN